MYEMLGVARMDTRCGAGRVGHVRMGEKGATHVYTVSLVKGDS